MRRTLTVTARECLAAACAVSLCFAFGCSSPSSPTPTPPTTNPPGTPTNPLSITCPGNVSGTSTTGAAIPVTFGTAAASGGVAPVDVSCTRLSGSLFPVGSTTVQCTATDRLQASVSCSFTVTINGVIPRLTRTRFLAFGDSTTAGEVTMPTTVSPTERTPNDKLIIIPSVAYPTQLVSLLRARYTSQASAIDVTNSGVPGEWAQDGARRLPGVMANLRPEAVLLLEGINDLSGEGSLGIDRAWRALDAMAKEARFRGARVFIATLPPSRPGGLRTVSPTLINSLNDRIRITAAGEGAALVDVFAALNSDVARYLGTDGLHLTEAGYRRLAEVFFDAIRSDLEAR